MELYNGVKSDNIEKKIDNKIIKAEEEIYCTLKKILNQKEEENEREKRKRKKKEGRKRE